MCRPLPTRPSHFVTGVLQPLRALTESNSVKAVQRPAQLRLVEVMPWTRQRVRACSLLGAACCLKHALCLVELVKVNKIAMCRGMQAQAAELLLCFLNPGCMIIYLSMTSSHKCCLALPSAPTRRSWPHLSASGLLNAAAKPQGLISHWDCPCVAAAHRQDLCVHPHLITAAHQQDLVVHPHPRLQAVVEGVSTQYAAMAAELLDTLRKTESSLARLRRNRPAEGAAADGSQLSDMDKISTQLFLDVQVRQSLICAAADSRPHCSIG